MADITDITDSPTESTADTQQGSQSQTNPETGNRTDFIKLVGDFTKDVLTTFPELADTLDENLRQVVIADDVSGVDDDVTDYIWNKCSKVYPPRFFDILYQNTDLFEDKANKEDTRFLPGIDFRKLWSQDISDKTRETIWKYLQLILLRVVSETSEDRSFGDTAKLFEAIDENALKDKLEQTIKDMESLFNEAGSSREGYAADGDGDGDGDGRAEADSTKPFSMGDLPNPDDLHNHISGLMKGKLGRLAQEIAEETAKDLGEDLGDVKTADQAFQKLFKNPGKLMSLVKTVGSKLEAKIKSGEIKESELLKEAGDFVTQMKDMPGLGNLKNVLGQMGMPGLGKDMRVNTGALNNMMRGAQTRDRLRAKLAKKQQEQQNLAQQGPTSTSGVVQTSTFSKGEVVEKSSRTRPASIVDEADGVTSSTGPDSKSAGVSKGKNKNKKGKGKGKGKGK